ncbi:MAG: YfhO family protein [Chitinispirillaceae bacterium]
MSKTKQQKKKKKTPAPVETSQVAVERKTLSKRSVFTFSVLLLLGLTLVYYWPLLISKGFLWNDFVEQNFPYRLFASKSLRQGIFPFWNPYVFSGMPFFADIQTAILYPFNLVMALFASKDWLSPELFQIQIVAHVFFAGICMYLLGRELRLGTTGALLSSVVFMFSAYLTTHIFHSNVIHAAAWFPLVVLLFKRMTERSSLLYMALSAAVLSVCMFAGHPQTMVHMYYWLGAFYLFFFGLRLKTKNYTLKSEAIRGALFAGMVALSVGLSSVQLLPTAELARESSRPEVSFEQSTIGSLRPYRLVTLAAPNFYGKPGTTYWGISSRDVQPGMHNYWETAVYAGILPLVLTFVAIFFIRGSMVTFLGSTGLLALLLSMGDSFFLYKLVFRFLPAMSSFRVPARFGFYFIFSVSLLAGYGLKFLIENRETLKSSSQKRIHVICGAVCGVSLLLIVLFSSGVFNQQVASFISSGMGGTPQGAAQLVQEKVLPQASNALWVFFLFLFLSCSLLVLRVNGKLSGKLLAAGAVAIVFFDLAVFGMGYAAIGKKDPNRVFAKRDLVTQFQEQGKREFFRINSRSSNPGTYEIGGGHMFFLRNQGSVHDLFLTEGYNQLRLKRQLVNSRDKTFDILNVKYKVKVDGHGRMGIASHPTALPRVWMANSYVVETREDSILPLLYSPDFDHRNSVILESEPELEGVTLGRKGKWNADITSYSLNRIEMNVSSENGGILVLSEIHYPAWKAYVDGKEAPLYRADYALRAIPVPKGEHKVVCRYESSSFTNGLLITLISILVTASITAFSIIKRRKQAAAAS